MSSDAGLARLKREFGGEIDEEVLRSVLAVCDNDAKQAVLFLTAGQGDIVEDPSRTNEESIPNDYPARSKATWNPTPAKGKLIDDERDMPLAKLVSKIKKMLVGDGLFKSHYELYRVHPEEYTCTALLLLYQGVEINKGAKARVLACLWADKKYNTARHILGQFNQIYGLPEVLRALQLLDTPRRIRALERRIKRLEDGKSKARKIQPYKSTVIDLKTDYIPNTSVSGSLCKKVREWVKTIPEENLVFFALLLPKDQWKALADIVHLRPSDFSCDWFLSVTFGDDPPKDSLVNVCKNLSASNIEQVLSSGAKIPYSFLRTAVKPLPDAAKLMVVKYSPLDTIIWFHEELTTPQVNQLISERLEKGEVPKFTYGKLMERLLYFKRNQATFYDKLIPIAQKRLESLEMRLESPVVVLGDGSYSMDVAIRTSTIISSVLTALTQAELKFFNVVTVDPVCRPSNVEQVIRVSETAKADGMTAPACCLWDYYKLRKVVKMFVVVTDEIENIKFLDKYYFPELFLKYYQEIYPAKLVFVSFLENPSKTGRMVQSLLNMNFDILQFRLDGTRPDLTKMDTLLGLLASESSEFPKLVRSLADLLKEKGLNTLIDRLQHPPDVSCSSSSSTSSSTTTNTAPVSSLSNTNNSTDESSVTEEESEVKDKGKARLVMSGCDVPDHLCCPITLMIMEDPVITPAGHSYERSAILEHLKHNKSDPFTAEPLIPQDLRPNRGLKEAINAYNRQNKKTPNKE